MDEDFDFEDSLYEERVHLLEHIKELSSALIKYDTLTCEPSETKVNDYGNIPNINIGLEETLQLDDIESRKLFILGEITEEVYSRINYFILRYNIQDKDIPIEEREPIKLHICSEGGLTWAGLGIVEAIRNSKTPVIGFCNSYALSMGFHIYIACHKRYATKNAFFLNHEGMDGHYDSSSKVRDYINFSERINERLNSLIIERTSFTEQELNELARVEVYMFADDAKNQNIVDYIIGEDCDLDEIL